MTEQMQVWLFRCVRCGKSAKLIANHCAECEPELHRRWNDARATVNNADEATPEMMSAFVELERVKNTHLT